MQEAHIKIPGGKMQSRLICAGAIGIALVVAPGAGAVPGNGNGTPPDNSAAAEGPPAYGQAGAPPAPPADPGPPTTPPGNSGSNPHGGPPVITGTPPTTPAAPPADPTPASPAGPVASIGADNGGSPGNGQGNGQGQGQGNGQGNGGPAEKVTICHATGFTNNPFVESEISRNGLNGHRNHEGDIIPAPDGGCDDIPVGEDDGDPEDQTDVLTDGGEGEEDQIEVLTDGGTGSADDSGPSADGAAGPDQELPFTGLFLGALAAIGLAFLAAGTIVDRAARTAIAE